MTPASEDFIEQLGGLVLDHQFKRLSRRLLAEGDSLYAQAGLQFRARWVSTYRLLDARPWLAIGEIAEQLRLTHPAVIQITGAMKKAGLLRSRRDRADARRRLVALSGKGLAMRDDLESLWATLTREQLELFAAAGVDIVALLHRVSADLDARPLTDRVLATATE